MPINNSNVKSVLDNNTHYNSPSNHTNVYHNSAVNCINSTLTDKKKRILKSTSLLANIQGGGRQPNNENRKRKLSLKPITMISEPQPKSKVQQTILHTQGYRNLIECTKRVHNIKK